MANTSRINGFRPVKHLNGSPYNGQATLYAVSSSNGTAIFVGDLVKLAADANAQGIQQVVPATAGVAGTGAAAVGVVMGILPSKMDPVAGKMTTGSIALDTPQYLAASTAGYVLVADATDLILEVEATNGGSAYSFAVTDVGNTCNVYAGAGSTTTGTSAHSADLGDKGTTATLPLKVVGVVQRVDNEITGNYTKILVQINNHQYKGGTGTAGV
jgi:hypothetical protein